ncbi:MAG: hypothetical protein HYU77_17705 [Betaproteobacteria bacterium]|nr:hypothetical protein [Betaproteobacteria bacterium]
MYFTYRSLVHPIVWFFQARTLVGMPSRETHRRIVDALQPNLNGSPARDSVLFSQACLAQFQAEALSRERRAETAAYNSGSHILYLTATLGLLFLLHDAALLPLLGRETPGTPELAAWAALLVVGLVAAVIYDRIADYREVVAVWRHERQYKDVVDSALRSWSIGTHPISATDRVAYLLGDGIMIASLIFAGYALVRGLRGDWSYYAFVGSAVFVVAWWWLVANPLLRRYRRRLTKRPTRTRARAARAGGR